MSISTFSSAMALLFVAALLWILMDVHFYDLSKKQQWAEHCQYRRDGSKVQDMAEYVKCITRACGVSVAPAGRCKQQGCDIGGDGDHFA